MPKIRPELQEILNRYGIDPRDASQVWDCHGVLVLYHKAFEIIGAKEGITFDPPIVLEADGTAKSVALCVVARMGERSEWATGEAAPGNNKNAYPYAMAEKRAKDRAIAKLVGLAAYIYSEDEADEFKEAKDQPDPRETACNRIINEIRDSRTEQDLLDIWKRSQGEIVVMSEDQRSAVTKAKDEMKTTLTRRAA